MCSIGMLLPNATRFHPKASIARSTQGRNAGTERSIVVMPRPETLHSAPLSSAQAVTACRHAAWASVSVPAGHPVCSRTTVSSG
jgi:hypothetical protein